MVDPFLLKSLGGGSLSGYIDQGGATSENNRAYQLNINIFIGENADMEKFKTALRDIKTEFRNMEELR